jgi:dihydropteroate synthase
VTERDELARVLPVVAAMAADGAIVSVDTMKPAVMRAAIAAGATMINDVRALAEPGALDAVAASGAAVCLMHMRGAPQTMQEDPDYADVVAEVRAFLVARAAACEAAGIARERILLDPGFGFGKSLAHNVSLLQALPSLVATGYPVLAGLSRKSMLGALTGRPVGERMAASVAAALAAVARGAAVVRVHDVRETVDALKVWSAAGMGAGSA